MDVVLALCAALSADSTIRTLVGVNSDLNQATYGYNVFDFELPEQRDFTMPQKCAIVRPHGGPKNFQMLALNDSRVEIAAYGETPHLAYTVSMAVYAVFKSWTPSVWASTYIHWVNEEAGPIPIRDPQLQWPYSVSTWNVRASDLTIQ